MSLGRFGLTLVDRISAGKLASAGVYDADAVARAAEIVERVGSDGYETIRLMFPDQHGILRGKTIVAGGLTSAFVSGLGVPSTLLLKDTSHRTAFPVWTEDIALDALPLRGANDVLMAPDPAAFYTVPWSPHSASILCNVLHRGGDPVGVSSRAVLSKAVTALQNAGYDALMGLETEFQVFEVTQDGLDHAQATMPPAPVTTRNTNAGWQYLTETRYGEAEALLDDLRRTCDAMGLAPRSMEIEMGPSQFEFTFDPADPQTQADRAVLFRTMVKEVCHRNGLHASFMARPRLPNAAANGWHIHQSVQDRDTGKNLFASQANTLTDTANGWIAGLLEHAEASCLLTTPTVNGYKRYGPYQLAPNKIQWGRDNRGAMIRALCEPGDPASRLENRVADSTANPYFAFAAQLLCGLDGVQRAVTPPPETTRPYDDGARKLPVTLGEAIAAFETSAFYRQKLGDGFVAYLAHLKRFEWNRYLAEISEWEQAEYFNLY